MILSVKKKSLIKRCAVNGALTTRRYFREKLEHYFKSLSAVKWRKKVARCRHSLGFLARNHFCICGLISFSKRPTWLFCVSGGLDDFPSICRRAVGARPLQGHLRGKRKLCSLFSPSFSSFLIEGWKKGLSLNKILWGNVSHDKDYCTEEFFKRSSSHFMGTIRTFVITLVRGHYRVIFLLFRATDAIVRNETKTVQHRDRSEKRDGHHFCSLSLHGTRLLLNVRSRV